MKYIIQIILGLLIGQTCFAQTDSVLISVNSKLISEIQIIIPTGELGIRENYTYFKYRYWIGKIDTISMSDLRKTENGFIELKKKKPLFYSVHNICDSTINKIRNSAQYWKMKGKIDQIARDEIGYGNSRFDKFRNQKENKIKDYHLECKEQFLADLNVLKHNLLTEIELIKQDKINRQNNLQSNHQTIDQNTISEFFKTFDLCNPDLKSLETIILANPSDFIQAVDKLSDTDFYSFTLKLDRFPKDSKIDNMKNSLKEINLKSRRKNKIIRKIKTTKG